MKRLLVCVLSASLIQLSFASRTNTVVNGISDWTKAESYVDQSFVPGDGDTVIIPKDCEVYVNTKAQNDFLAKLERILPSDPTSRIVFTVPETETWKLTCAVTKAVLPNAGGTAFENGEVVKRGLGTLLMGGGNRLVVSGHTGYDCWTCLTVEEGLLKLDGDATPNLYLGYLSISNNATFQMGQTMCVVRGLFGEGMVTNTPPGQSTFQNIGALGQRRSRFSGRLCGNFPFLQNGEAGIDLLGTNNVFSVPSGNNNGGMRAGKGEVAVRKIGMKGEPSSVGDYSNIHLYDHGNSRLTYIGTTGETTDKTIYTVLSSDDVTRTTGLSGGPHGGVTFTGIFSLGAATADHISRNFIFSGSNEVECVVDAEVYGCYKNPGGSAFDCLYYRKEESGAWRFTQHPERLFPSGFAIREGALRFDSLHERGQLSSLGLATNLTDGTGYAYTPQVDYAYALGTTESGKADAVFEYTGTNGFQCSTRPIALAGDGHIRNDTARRIRFAGVSSLAAGKETKTLVLDGTGLNTNEVADITDGAGRTGLTKDGTGTWAVSGDLTFHGPLAVNAGTLIVRRTLPGKYTWFRWTMKDMMPDKAGHYGTRINVCSFALFDSTGAFQSNGLQENGCYSELEPGEFGFQTDYYYTLYAQTDALGGEPWRLFSGSNDYGLNAWFYPPRTTTAKSVRLHAPESWVPIVMRLPDSAKEIASFDYMNTWGGTNSANIICSSLEGSVDGLHWNMLTNNLTTTPCAVSWEWDISHTKGYGAHTGGAPVAGSTAKTYSVLENVESVSVAPGATLVAEGDVEISKLAIDASGAGTFDGFTFAEDGEIAFTGVEKGKAVTIPVTFANSAESLQNLSTWSFTINGQTKNYSMKVTADGITLLPPGMMLIVR